MWRVVERAEIAARPGRVWRVVREIQSYETPVISVDVVDEPREFAWTSLLSSDDGAGERTEAQWWFRLAPNWTGTEVEHGIRVERVPTVSEELDVRRRLVATLANVKARAEAAH